MFGKNPIRKLDRTPEDGKLAVQEVFYTIQGEGPYSGMPAVFIRLAGCHLACTFCDTEFESGINNRLTVTETVMAAMGTIPESLRKVPIVVLTGGEPMRQRLAPLIYALLSTGIEKVQIETAGNLWEPELSSLVQNNELTIVCSPKTPHVHSEIIHHCGHWKYVVAHGQVGGDGLPIMGTQANGQSQLPWNLYNQAPRATSDHTVWISPCDAHDITQNKLNMATAVEVCLKHGYRLSLQTHKIVNVP